jgi:Astacin (Peptidase family M12A)
MRLMISLAATPLVILVFCSTNAWAQFYCAKKALNTCNPASGASGSQPSHNIVGFWPTRTIAVVFSPKLSDALKKAAREEIGKVGFVSGYNFFECQESKVEKQAPYMYIDNLPQLKGDHNACWSAIGFIKMDVFKMKTLYGVDYGKFPFRLPVSIGGDDCNATDTKGAIGHEILHRLGLKHEHEHPDSHKYLIPLADELKEHENDFALPKGNVAAIRFDTTRFTDTYDLVSIMHYALPAFTEVPSSGDGETPLAKLIKTKGYDKSFDRKKDIGQRHCVSAEDARFLQYLSSGIAPNLPCDRYGVARASNACTQISPPAASSADSGSSERVVYTGGSTKGRM